MSEKRALLRAIAEAPDDEAPRLIYADWLEENGQPALAAVIRRQVARVRLGRAKTGTIFGTMWAVYARRRVEVEATGGAGNGG